MQTSALSTSLRPNDLAGYYSLASNLLYHPVQVDRTLRIAVESDAIRACHSHIVDPVNMVLSNNPYIRLEPR
jgi:hypothetical protein